MLSLFLFSFLSLSFLFFFFNDTATTEIYTLSLHDALPILYDALLDGRSLADARFTHVHFPYLDVVPATQDLVGAELELVNKQGRETMMRRALRDFRERSEERRVGKECRSRWSPYH